MTPLSHRLYACAPAFLVTLLIFLSASPLTISGIALAPNMAWLATIAIARLPGLSWPAWLAFALGLLQDIVFATPLGAQATIAVLLLLAMRARPVRVGVPLLRDSWLEAAVSLLAAHLLLAVILQWIVPSPPPIMNMLHAVMISILWFPAIAWGAGKLALKLAK